MDSLTYKGLCSAFEKGLMRLTERLELAVDGDLSQEEADEVRKAVRSKLADYETSLSRFGNDAGTRSDFEEEFKVVIKELREGLAKL